VFTASCLTIQKKPSSARRIRKRVLALYKIALQNYISVRKTLLLRRTWAMHLRGRGDGRALRALRHHRVTRTRAKYDNNIMLWSANEVSCVLHGHTVLWAIDNLYIVRVRMKFSAGKVDRRRRRGGARYPPAASIIMPIALRVRIIKKKFTYCRVHTHTHTWCSIYVCSRR